MARQYVEIRAFEKQVEFIFLQYHHNPPEMMALSEVRLIFSHLWGSVLLKKSTDL